MREKFTIVVADDDVDDQDLIKNGLSECKIQVQVVPVFDGLKLMDYLLRRHEYKNVEGRPDLILLDLNMPLMDGFLVLNEIRKYVFLRKIPIYVITTSRSPSDKQKALELGAAGFYSKGTSSRDIVRIMKEICKDCFDNLPVQQNKNVIEDK
jgi:CheY-like chemotaxis protein